MRQVRGALWEGRARRHVGGSVPRRSAPRALREGHRRGCRPPGRSGARPFALTFMRSLWSVGDVSIFELLVNGTHKGPFAGVAASGKHVRVVRTTAARARHFACFTPGNSLAVSRGEA